MMEPAQRKALRAVVLELRGVLEGRLGADGVREPGDLADRLAQLGLGRSRPPIPLEALPTLGPAERRARAELERALGERVAAGHDPCVAYDGLLHEAAHGWANRLLTLRCLESRGIIDEVIVRREAYAGRSLEHHRLARRSPESCQGEDDGLYAVLSQAFAAQARRLPRLFDPAALAMAVRPSPAALGRCLGLLGGQLAARGGERIDTESWCAADALGWAYQYWNAEERRAALDALRLERGAKLEGARLVAATQLYTEPTMVEFLVQNALGGLWSSMHPESPLVRGWSWWVASADRAALAPKPVEDIRVLDPACGSGHFLVAAFDLFYDMYCEQDPARAPAEICRAIVERNLWGIDLDARAVEIAEAALWMKVAERGVDLGELQPRLLAASPSRADDLGSLRRVDATMRHRAPRLAELLAQSYDVVLCNPPYVDKRDYGAELRAALRRDYPAGSGNTFAAFVLRCLELSSGTVGMVTPQTFLFLRSYEPLRQHLHDTATVEVLVRLGTGAFRDAAVDAAMFVLRREPDESRRRQAVGIYLDLCAARDKPAALRAALRAPAAASGGPLYRRSLAELAELPGRPFAFSAGSGTLRCFRELAPLRTRADVVLGMKTSDNRRFVRLWWELEGSRAELRAEGWLPYDKQASGQRYASSSAHYVRWTPATLAHYRGARTAQLPNERYWFRPGIVYGLVSHDFAAKLLPPGHMSDMAASCVFPHRLEDTSTLLGLLNCRLGQYWLRLLNPTVNFQPGDVQRLPLGPLDDAAAAVIGRAVVRAVAAAGALRRAGPTDRAFVPEPWTSGGAQERVRASLCARLDRELELSLAGEEIDRQALALYRVPAEDLAAACVELGRAAADYPKSVEDEQARTCAIAAAAAAGGVDRSASLLEHLAHAVHLHPASVHRLLRQGVVSDGWRLPAQEQALAADVVTVLVLRCFGHRWPAEIVRGDPCARPSLPDGIVAPRHGNDEHPLLELVRTRLVAELGGERAQRAEGELGTLLGKSLGSWLDEELFAHHHKQFRRRPLLWQLASTRAGVRARPAFVGWLYAHRLDEDTLPKLRSQHLGPPMRAHRAELASSGCADPGHRRAIEQRLQELGDFDLRLQRIAERGFGCSALDAALAGEPLDRWCASDGAHPPPADKAQLAALEARYVPSRSDGIRVNLAPLALGGVLRGEVLGRADAERAVAERASWRAAERGWCRAGTLERPSWWPAQASAR
jgi:hypothetical protein